MNVDRIRGLWWFAWAFGLAGCGAPTGDPVRDEPPPPAATPSFDVSSLVRRAHFAWRGDGARWTGGHTTYRAESSAEGTTVTPYQHGRAGDAVHLAAAVARRGDVAIATTTASGAVDDEGVLTLARGAMQESLRNVEAGVEQSWTFATRPAGHDALVLRVGVDGARFLGATANGLHFAAGGDALGVRYGRATWVDARGTRTDVGARFADGAIELTVPAATLDASAYPAVLDPMISPEWGIDRPVFAPTPVDAQVTARGDGYLVAWSVDRAYRATRVDAHGVVLDRAGFDVAPPSPAPRGAQQNLASLTRWGDGYVGLWGMYRYTGTVDLRGVNLALYDDAGLPSAPGLTVVREGQYPGSAIVASNGRDALLLVDTPVTHAFANVALRPLRRDGTLGDETPVGRLENAERRMASNGGTVLAVWSHGGVVARVDGTLVRALDDAPWTDNVRVAAQGPDASRSDYLVVWSSNSLYGFDAGEVRGARVSPSGVVRDPTGFVITASSTRRSHVTLGFDGVDFVTAWSDTRGARACSVCSPDDASAGLCDPCECNWQCDPTITRTEIDGARVTVAGVVRDTTARRLVVSGDFPDNPVINEDGGHALLVWRTDDALRGSPVDARGALTNSDGRVLAVTANREARPAVTAGDDGFLAVWEDSRAGAERDIYGARLDGDGRVLDPRGIAISTARGDQTAPSVGFARGRFLVAWQDLRHTTSWDVYASRVDERGRVLDPRGIAVSTADGDQGDVAVDGSLVVWSDGRREPCCPDPVAGYCLHEYCDPMQATNVSDVFGARVDADGAVLDPAGIALSSPDVGNAYAPSVIWDGSRHLVAWNSRGAFVARVNARGVVLDPAGIALPLDSVSSITTSPGMFVAVGTTSTPFRTYGGAFHGSVRAHNVGLARVRSNGAVLDASAVLVAPLGDPASAVGSFEHPAVAYDGHRLLVAWEVLPGYGLPAHVSAQWTGLDGTPRGTAFDLTTGAGAVAPALASHEGAVLATWQQSRFVDSLRDGAEERVQGAIVPYATP